MKDLILAEIAVLEEGLKVAEEDQKTMVDEHHFFAKGQAQVYRLTISRLKHLLETN